MPVSRLSFLLACLLPCVAAAGVPASVWPGVTPCNTTLQACIDATADGGSVLVATSAAIDENLNLYNRSLTVAAASGAQPRLASGRWISVSSAAILGNQNVTLRGLSLSDGYVWAAYNGIGTATFDFSGLVLDQVSSPTYIRIEGRTGNTVQARLYGNRITAIPRNLNAGLVEIVDGGGTVNASVYYNSVRSSAATAGEGAGILVDAHSGGGGTLKIHGNTVRGGFFRGGIFVSEGLFSSTASDIEARVYSNVVVCAAAPASGSTGNGIGFVANNGRIGAQALNNTLTRCSNGISANQWSGGGAGASVSGLVKNNLIAGERGLVFTAALTASLSNDYNLLNVANNIATPGANTITADARLVDRDVPRLRADSPAIDAADSAALGLGLIFNALPTTDADGLRRFKGPGGATADIGAYEYGDRSLLHVADAANTTGHVTRIDDVLLDDQADAAPIATPNWNAVSNGIANDTPFGIYYFSGKWRLFSEDAVTPVPAGAAWNVFVPGAGGGAFRHVSSAANSSGSATTLDSSSLNNLPERIVLVTQNWSAGSSVYNAHPIGLNYVATGPSAGSWRIANLDGAAMPANAGFDVYAQEASPNAFRVDAPAGGNGIVLDHPLLNGNRCARAHVSRIGTGSAAPRNFDVYYGTGNGRWQIYSYSPLQAGMAFNVVVDPAQVFDCGDRIFANRFGAGG
ncbi:MAG TPA: choice-of-anchor Q domain-containing protein [Tahibacter sp.]|nr:choice-of-anchor Q domain-containing protein [Tahibacter sp.]